jgi:hypothetical protein
MMRLSQWFATGKGRSDEEYINRVSTNNRACPNARLGTFGVREMATTTVVCCTFLFLRVIFDYVALTCIGEFDISRSSY